MPNLPKQLYTDRGMFFASPQPLTGFAGTYVLASLEFDRNTKRLRLLEQYPTNPFNPTLFGEENYMAMMQECASLRCMMDHQVGLETTASQITHDWLTQSFDNDALDFIDPNKTLEVTRHTREWIKTIEPHQGQKYADNLRDTIADELAAAYSKINTVRLIDLIVTMAVRGPLVIGRVNSQENAVSLKMWLTNKHRTWEEISDEDIAIASRYRKDPIIRCNRYRTVPENIQVLLRQAIALQSFMDNRETISRYTNQNVLLDNVIKFQYHPLQRKESEYVKDEAKAEIAA